MLFEKQLPFPVEIFSSFFLVALFLRLSKPSRTNHHSSAIFIRPTKLGCLSFIFYFWSTEISSSSNKEAAARTDRQRQQQGSSELRFPVIYRSLQVTIFGAKGLVIFNLHVLLQILSFLAWISWIFIICSWAILFN